MPVSKKLLNASKFKNIIVIAYAFAVSKRGKVQKSRNMHIRGKHRLYVRTKKSG